MKFNIIFVLFSTTLFCTISCQQNTPQTPNQMINLEKEKAAILAVINNETKAAFNRDYKGWKEKWVHQSYVTKTYMNFADTTMTETLDWKEIDDFVRTYIEDHPEPDPLPTLVDDIKIRLYGTGAWVSFEQNDVERGRKRETRLMEKVDEQWKIAGMQTIIYGFEKEK